MNTLLKLVVDPSGYGWMRISGGVGSWVIAICPKGYKLSEGGTTGPDKYVLASELYKANGWRAKFSVPFASLDELYRNPGLQADARPLGTFAKCWK